MKSLDSSLHRKFIYEYLRALDCPRALTVYLLYMHGEHDQLCEVDFEPLHYNDIRSARDSLAASKFLSKANFLHTSHDVRKKAIDKFFECELQCRDTNNRFRHYRFTSSVTHSVLLRMSYLCHAILGSFSAEEFVDSCDFGPGASVSIKRRDATRPNKFQFETGITATAYDVVKDWFRAAYPIWDPQFKIVNSNKIVTVPKNSKTDRTIAIEPGFNIWFQKGIGSMIRRRLRGKGIDLSDQSINQERARIGAKFNHLATVDFSAASDTISKSLVREIIPKRWLNIMDCFRSSTGVLDKTVIEYEKYSSMGNGFTFELESLIFYVAALAVCEHLSLSTVGVSVYGDDVILPSDAVILYEAVCKDLGFTVNKSKSYSSGCYRESCGAHYWRGIDIKPIFLKEDLHGRESILKACNSVRRLAHRRNTYGCDRRLRRCWSLLSASLGLKFPRVSEGFGDIGIIENLEDSYTKLPPDGLEGFLAYSAVSMPVVHYVDHQGLLLTKLRDIGSANNGRGDGNETPFPLRKKNIRKNVLIPRWYDLGPWI